VWDVGNREQGLTGIGLGKWPGLRGQELGQATNTGARHVKYKSRVGSHAEWELGGLKTRYFWTVVDQRTRIYWVWLSNKMAMR
jgi:hypothetical protein